MRLSMLLGCVRNPGRGDGTRGRASVFASGVSEVRMRLGRSLVLAAIALTCSPAQAGQGVSWNFQNSSGIAANGSAFKNIAARSGTQCAFIQQKGWFEQSFKVAEGGGHVVSFWASLRWWPTASHDFDVLVDGNSLGRVGPTQLSAYAWRKVSFPVDLAAGKHTLRFQGVNSKEGDFTSFIEDVRIASASGADVPLRNAGFDDVRIAASSFVRRPAEKTEALFKLEGKVTTSGKAIYGRIVGIADGRVAPLQAIATMPTVKVNGRDVGTPTTLVNTGEHEGFVLLLPEGVGIGQGDAVTLSAPEAWATVSNDFCVAMEGQPIEVCTGRSFVGTDSMERTLKLGFNFGHLITPYWGVNAITKNLRVRIQRWEGGVTGADANWYPTRLSQESADAFFIEDNSKNGIDGTGVPTPEGLYAVGWGRSSPVVCSIVSRDADVTERVDLANPGNSRGQGLVRVFRVKRKPGAVRTNFSLALRITDRTRAPRLTYLAIYGPGDFKWAANTPTVLEDVEDLAAPSAMMLYRTSSGLGTARFADGMLNFDNAANVCEPEHLLPESRFAWHGWVKNWRINYVQARPWTREGSPYIYSSLFGEPYPATLGQSLAAARPGAIETVEIPDAETAPVLEGLVLRAGAERMRVLSVSGTTVKLERGSESTTPATHEAGPILVSGRHAVESLASFAKQDKQVTELVTREPHRFRTGMHAYFEGDGWGAWTYSDGSKAQGGSTLHYYRYVALVTGPNTFVVVGGKAATRANVTLPAPVKLDPSRCFTDVHIPPAFGMPYSAIARLAADRGADLYLNFTFGASDTLVDHIARIVRDNYPPGRRIYLEYINEPWNWAYVTSHSQATFNWLLGKVPEGGFLWQVRRTGQIHKRFAAVFEEVGRAGEVRSILNMQQGTARLVRQIVQQARSEKSPIPDVAIAPYTEFSHHPSIVKGLNVADLDQAVDLWIYNLVYGTKPITGSVTHLKAHREAVNAVNKEFGTAVELHGYEGGVETAWPEVTTKLAQGASARDTTFQTTGASLFSPGQYLRIGSEWVRVRSISGKEVVVERARGGTAAAAYKAGAVLRNSWIESGRDLVYNPLFRIAEFDQFGLWQRYFDSMTINGFALHFVSGAKLWGMYHWLGQLPGRGDGSDGRFDNRTLLASPGYPSSKRVNQNQDLKAVSVRGQALIEWNQGASKK